MISIKKEWEENFPDMTKLEAIDASIKKWNDIEHTLRILISASGATTCALCKKYKHNCNDCPFTSCSRESYYHDYRMGLMHTYNKAKNMLEKLHEIRIKHYSSFLQKL